jgi:Right handed beta helix region
MSYQFTAGRFKGFAADGTPLAGGRLYTFASGTTTFKAAYTDATLGTSCTYVNDGTGALYIALDARGEAQLWLGSGAYSFALKTSAGAGVWTVDGVADDTDGLRTDLASTATGKAGALIYANDGSGGSIFTTVAGYIAKMLSTAGASLVGWIQSGIGAVARTLGDRAKDTVSVFDFMTPAQIEDVRAGTALVDVTAAIQAAIDSFGTESGCVLFPVGVYKTSAPIVLRDFVSLQGMSMISMPGYYFDRGATIKGAFSGPMIKYEVTLAAQPLENGFSVTDIMLNGGNVCTSGVYLQRFRSVHFHRVVVRDCKDYGFWLDEQESQSSNTCVLEDCYVNNSFLAAYRVCGQWAKLSRCISDGGFYSVLLDKTASGALITGCHFEAPYDTGIKMSGGGGNKIIGNNIFLYRYKLPDGTNGTTPYPAQLNQIGIKSESASGGWYNTIIGNQIRYSTDGGSPSATSANIRGVSVTDNVSHINTISSNTIYGFPYGIWLAGDKNSVSSNMVSASAECVRIDSSYNTVSGGYMEIYPTAAGTYAVNALAGIRNSLVGINTSEAFNGIDPALQVGAGSVSLLAGPVVLKSYVVSALPAASSAAYGRAFVTDADSTTFASVVAGGGANKVPVWSNGTSWLIG